MGEGVQLMTKRMTRAERRASGAAARQQMATFDGYQNVSAGLGIGADNLMSASTYSVATLTNNRQQLENMYCGSWIVGQAVDAPAEDMTRAGIEITSDDGPEILDEVHANLDALQIAHHVCNAIKWSRLYGGAIIVHLVEGQDLSTPLRPETVGKGQYKGVVAIDRWSLEASSDKVMEYGPDLGQPKYYRVFSDAPALAGCRVHHSRVIRLDGDAIPHSQRLRFNGWGMSVVERLYDRLAAFDSTTVGAAQLMFKAHLRTISVDGLRDILAAGGAPEQALTKMFQWVRTMQSSEGLTVLDAKDKFETHTYSFAGVSDTLMQFAQQISGALQIPLVRLFGQSPAGLNSTGESDIRSYYDRIERDREDKLRGGYGSIAKLAYRSTTGQAPPKGFGFDFRSLWQMSDREKAEIAVGVTGAVVQAVQAGLVSEATGLRELRRSSDVTGVWSNIKDEDIDEAESNPPTGEIDSDGSSDPGDFLSGLIHGA